MLQFLALAAVAGFASQDPAHEVPEWVRYRSKLTALPAFEVSFRSYVLTERAPVLRDSWGLLKFRAPSSYVIDLPRERIFWDGKRCTRVDRISNRMDESSKLPRTLFHFFRVLKDPAEYEFPGTLVSHLTLKPVEKGPGLTGFRTRVVSVDQAFSTEWWFSPEFSLPVEIHEGMDGSTRSYGATYKLAWNTSPTFASDEFVPKKLLTANQISPPASKVATYVRKTFEGGMGGLHVEAPKHVKVGVELQIHDAMIRGQVGPAPFRATLPEYRYRLELGESAIQLVIKEGFETRFLLGAIKNAGSVPIQIADQRGVRLGTLGPNQVSDALLPGEYSVVQGRVRSSANVRPGQVLKVGAKKSSGRQ